MRRTTACLFVAALLAPVAAGAQDKRIDVNIGAGYTFSLSDVRKHLGDGYHITAGLTFNLAPAVGIRAEYGYSDLSEKQVDLPVSMQPAGTTTNQPFYAHMTMQYGTFNLVFNPKKAGKTRPYAMAGLGIYSRPVKVTTASVGYTPGLCDPFWYVCAPGAAVGVDQILGSRKSTDVGVDFGGGVNITMTDTASLYIEARYLFIFGPELTDTAGKSYGKANGRFLPITLGIRF